MSTAVIPHLENVKPRSRRVVYGRDLCPALRPILLLSADVIGLTTAAVLARPWIGDVVAHPISFLVIVVALFCAVGLYQIRALDPVTELRRLVCSICLAGFSFLFVAAESSHGLSALLWLGFATPLLATFRSALRSFLIQSEHELTPAVIIGSGTPASRLDHLLTRQKHLGLRPIAILDQAGAGGQCLAAAIVLFRQTRIGKDGQCFRAWKFRSMVVDAEKVLKAHLDANPQAKEEWELTQKLKDDPRISTIGRWLRTSSLDELPQLWNVMRGEMSLVGPRPIVPDEIERYGSVSGLYKMVRPGMTGLWQVSGRSNTSYEERVSLDEYYVKNRSVYLDFHILVRTVRTLLLREGAC